MGKVVLKSERSARFEGSSLPVLSPDERIVLWEQAITRLVMTNVKMTEQNGRSC